ncbi:penicillin-binding protein 1C [Rhizobium sp. 9140]|uniref:penicillin-binding protein 1C n=1 Tax=Rhizobium sp. 9140 TaxID=1761900 RepID=UPI000799C8B2|nr:penicillin-binding protein 1C [Rhizobium sp. 9140]CZT33479.1 penicillin-binding protein 1C [Rhizobium sp. 9140]
MRPSLRPSAVSRGLARTLAGSVVGGGILLGLGIGALFAVDAADHAYPPPLAGPALTTSAEMVDRDGRLLRAFATADGRWRLRTTAQDVDPQFVRMLIAYEDRRFAEHGGIDIRALARAAVQFVTHGRIVSGASTLSMQVARLIEPRESRSIGAKLRQMARAWQLERRLTKAQILDLYLTHAPYGGNLEGVRAASLAYFGKEPRRLTVAEAALLVALPQLPERRRPDRHPKAAEAARARVLGRAAVAAVIGEGEAERAAVTRVPESRRPLPTLSPHLAETARRKAPAAPKLHTTLVAPVQAALEAVAKRAAERAGPRISVAMVMADAATGEILAEVGSADYLDSSRKGWIDMTRVPRSPGSTLKPFIYGLAFEEGLVSQETVIEDRPADFFGYRPRNFDMTYQGDVTIRQALQLSLNVPAIRLLDAVGPSRLMLRMRRAGISAVLPPQETPGLAIGLGGLGVTLRDLVQLYAGLANEGRPMRLGDGVDPVPEAIAGEPMLDPAATWQIADILSGVLPPTGSARRGIAYKTGTSYGYRDAWSVGYDGRTVLGVWVGRADNGAVPGITGYATAAPILFEAFAKSGIASVPLPRAPTGAVRIAAQDLPISQRRFSMTTSGLLRANIREAAPQIVYPPEGARVDLGKDVAGVPLPLMLKLQGGRAPFRWLANGRPLADLTRRRVNQWVPDGAGYSTLTVIDAAGQAASVRVFLQ